MATVLIHRVQPHRPLSKTGGKTRDPLGEVEATARLIDAATPASRTIVPPPIHVSMLNLLKNATSTDSFIELTG